MTSRIRSYLLLLMVLQLLSTQAEVDYLELTESSLDLMEGMDDFITRNFDSSTSSSKNTNIQTQTVKYFSALDQLHKVIKILGPSISIALNLIFGGGFSSESYEILSDSIGQTYDQLIQLSFDIVQQDLTMLSSNLKDFIVIYGAKRQSKALMMSDFTTVCGVDLTGCFTNHGYVSSIFPDYLEKSETLVCQFTDNINLCKTSLFKIGFPIFELVQASGYALIDVMNRTTQAEELNYQAEITQVLERIRSTFDVFNARVEESEDMEDYIWEDQTYFFGEEGWKKYESDVIAAPLMKGFEVSKGNLLQKAYRLDPYETIGTVRMAQGYWDNLSNCSVANWTGLFDFQNIYNETLESKEYSKEYSGYCPVNKFIMNLYTSPPANIYSGWNPLQHEYDYIGHIDQAYCCEPSNSYGYKDCEDVQTEPFFKAKEMIKCEEGSYLVGLTRTLDEKVINSTAQNSLANIVKVRCCSFELQDPAKALSTDQSDLNMPEAASLASVMDDLTESSIKSIISKVNLPLAILLVAVGFIVKDQIKKRKENMESNTTDLEHHFLDS